MSDIKLNAKQRQVREFIDMIRGASPMFMGNIFTRGGCYRFYEILKERFPCAVACDEHKHSHVWTKIHGIYWDIRGPRLRKKRGGNPFPMNAACHRSYRYCQFDEVRYIGDLCKKD